MQTVLSPDGTLIAYEIAGSGPLLIILTGALNTHNFGGPSDLVPLLQDDFTVLVYDRRGRGQSTNTLPYAVYKEIEDLQALIMKNGGVANLYGHSAGGALALFAAAELPDLVNAVAAFEPPMSNGWMNDLATNQLIRQMEKQVSRGENLEVVTRFMRFVGMSEDKIAETLSGEHGKTLINMAATIAYEAKIQSTSRHFLKAKAGLLSQPVLMLAGDKSFKTAPRIMRAFSKAIPLGHSELVLEQTHSVDAKVLAPILREFFLINQHPASL